ncbi:MAG: peptidyl-prolyl cis-trans isomerase [Planctomycetota bacterium]|jgi:parvulin-like peptidyl-prolyl isomerase|nr:peptidyl-prolyl cis-trans isomerase [Planctomycetota bacterium]
MLRGCVKPLGIILGGILCLHLSAFAAETDAQKPSSPPKKAKAEVKSEAKAVANEPKQKDATAAPVKKEDDSNKILATVNGENINQKDVNLMLSRFGNQISEEQLPAVTKQILDGLITQKLIMQFIKENKIEPAKATIDTELNKVREEIKSNPSLANQTLEQVLESHGSSIDDLKKDITISLSLEKYLGKELDDQKLKAYFEQNKAAYDETEVKASHVLVDTRTMKTDEELAQAKDKINKAKADVVAGKDFADIAKQYSDCPSKEKGGDLGFFKRKGQMVEPFAAAAFALKIGQISDPIKTNFGYHIIKVTEIKQGKDVKFDDIKQNVKQDILQEKAQVLISQLRQKAKIDIKA